MRLLDRLQELERQALAVAKARPDHPLLPAALVELQRVARRLGLAGGRPEAVARQAIEAQAVEAERLAAQVERMPAPDPQELAELRRLASQWSVRPRSRA